MTNQGNTMIKKITAGLLSIVACSAFADNYNEVSGVFKDVPLYNKAASPIPLGKNSVFRIVEGNLDLLRQGLKSVDSQYRSDDAVKTVISLPLPDGSWHRYAVVENGALSPELSMKYPQIKTYDAYGIDDPMESVKFDVTPLGFHGMIRSPNHDTILIDPYSKQNQTQYMVYEQKDVISKHPMTCETRGGSEKIKHAHSAHSKTAYIAGCTLKKLRIAIAATAEYTAYVSGTTPGTKPQALAAIASTLNRANGIFESEVAVTMELVQNEDDVIFTDPNTQPPYDNNHVIPSAALNNTVLNTIIGTGNYDLGQVFLLFSSDGGQGGIADINSVCKADKGRASSALDARFTPERFYMLFTHEIGHQLGSFHTFSETACNQGDTFSIEPGSGSTIMSYAGGCNYNVQSIVSDYFHGQNIDDMNFVIRGLSSCGIDIPAPPSPIITSTNGGSTVPINTPLSLEAHATNGQSVAPVLFNWEELDFGDRFSPQIPLSTDTRGPNFRSFPPSIDNTRYFPRLGAAPSTWEVTPSVTRTMKWRVTARGNHPAGGSCSTVSDIVTVTTNENAGPFIVTYPTDKGVVWVGNTLKTITWDVANTNIAPVSATTVDILISLDNGKSYPMVLATAIPNNGSANITVPNIATTTARIMVRSGAHTFFNVSNNPLQIQAATVAPAAQIHLTQAERVPAENTTVYIYYNQLTAPQNSTFTLVGGPQGATVNLDAAHGRFVVSHFTSTVASTVKIQALANSTVTLSNEVSVPGIL